MFFTSRLLAIACIGLLLSSCATLLGLDNECAVVYEQNLELSKPPIVPNTTGNINNP